MGNLGTAIQGAQKNALANKLMNEADIANQPGAGVTQDLGKLPSDSGDSGGASSDDQLRQAMTASQLSAPSGQTQDLGQLPPAGPQPSLGINPDIPPVSPDTGDADLAQAMAASRLSDNSPTVGSVAGGPQPNAKPPVASGGDFTLNPSDYSGGGKKVGSMVHTGGTAEMELQKEMLAMQLQKAAVAKAQAGPVVDPIERAQKLANLALTRQRLAAGGQPKPGKVDKNPPPVDINGQPVDSQNQLTNYVDGLHGKGTMSAINSAVASGVDAGGNPLYPGKDDKGNQIQVPSTISIPLNKSKSVKIPLAALQTYVKQQNAQLLKQHQPLMKVPGEDQSVGGSADNPYPATSLLDAKSRASGTWVKLPNGKLWQVP